MLRRKFDVLGDALSESYQLQQNNVFDMSTVDRPDDKKQKQIHFFGDGSAQKANNQASNNNENNADRQANNDVKLSQTSSSSAQSPKLQPVKRQKVDKAQKTLFDVGVDTDNTINHQNNTHIKTSQTLSDQHINANTNDTHTNSHHNNTSSQQTSQQSNSKLSLSPILVKCEPISTPNSTDIKHIRIGRNIYEKQKPVVLPPSKSKLQISLNNSNSQHSKSSQFSQESKAITDSPPDITISSSSDDDDLDNMPILERMTQQSQQSRNSN